MRKRNVVVALIFGLAIAVVAYKAYEGHVLNELGSQYRDNMLAEITEVDTDQDFDGLNNLRYELYYPTDENRDLNQSLELLSEIQNKQRPIEDWTEGYLALLEKNQSQLLKTDRWVIGQGKSNLRKFLNEMTKYYDHEIASVRDGLVELQYLTALDETYKDELLLVDLVMRNTNDKQEVDYASMFSSLSFLKKYSNSEHAFSNEGQIREQFPSRYDHFKKVRDVFKSVYAVSKEYSSGDYESADYKWKRLNTVLNDYNFDYEELLFEGDTGADDNKKTVELALARTLLVKQIEDYIKKNPFVRNPIEWEEDVEVCQMYDIKAHLFWYIMDSYPKATSEEDFLKELETVNPKTAEVDKLFDVTLMTLNNSENALEIVCHSSEGQERYRNVTSKIDE